MKGSANRQAANRPSGLTPLGAPELTFARREGEEAAPLPHPRLIALVRALARQAAREIHAEHMQEHRKDRS